jgi:hypothetical protein
VELEMMNALMRAAYEEKRRLLNAYLSDTLEGRALLLSGFSGKGDECYEKLANYFNSIGVVTRYGKPIEANTVKRWRYLYHMPFLSMRRRHGSSITLISLLAWMWAMGDVATLKRRF